MSINSQNIGKIKDIVRHVNSKIREEHNAMKKRVLDKIRAERKMDIKKAREQLNEKLKSKLISIGRKNREQLITDLNKHRKHWPTIKEPKKIVKSEKQPPKPDDKTKAPAPKATPKAAAPKPASKKPFDCSKCDKGSYTKVCVKCMKKDLAKAQKTTDETKVQYVTKKIKGTIRRIPVKKLDDAEKKKQLKKQLEPKPKAAAPKAAAPKAAPPKAAAPKAAPPKAKPFTPAKKVDNDKAAFRAKQKEKNARRREKEYKASYDDLPKSYKDIMDKLKEANLKPKTLKIVQPIYDEAIRIRNAMDKKKNEGNATDAEINLVMVMLNDVDILLIEMFNQTLKNKATLSTPIIKQAKENIKKSQEALGTEAPKAAAPKAAAPKAAH